MLLRLRWIDLDHKKVNPPTSITRTNNHEFDDDHHHHIHQKIKHTLQVECCCYYLQEELPHTQLITPKSRHRLIDLQRALFFVMTMIMMMMGVYEWSKVVNWNVCELNQPKQYSMTLNIYARVPFCWFLLWLMIKWRIRISYSWWYGVYRKLNTRELRLILVHSLSRTISSLHSQFCDEPSH